MSHDWDSDAANYDAVRADVLVGDMYSSDWPDRPLHPKSFNRRPRQNRAADSSHPRGMAAERNTAPGALSSPQVPGAGLLNSSAARCQPSGA